MDVRREKDADERSISDAPGPGRGSRERFREHYECKEEKRGMKHGLADRREQASGARRESNCRERGDGETYHEVEPLNFAYHEQAANKDKGKQWQIPRDPPGGG